MKWQSEVLITIINWRIEIYRMSYIQAIKQLLIMKTMNLKSLRRFYAPAMLVGFALFFSNVNDALAQRGQQGGQGQGQGQGQNQGQRRSPAENLDRTLKFLVDSIGIDAKQKTLVEGINAKYVKQYEALRTEADGGADKDAMREKMKDVTKKYDTEVSAVLTKEQLVKYNKSKEQRKNAYQKQQGNNSGGGGNRGGGSGQQGQRGGQN